MKDAILQEMTEVKKALVLLLSANSNAPIQGKLWYQKEMFMLSKNNSVLREEVNFEPYFWGPHSDLVDEEMEELVQLGVVKKEGNNYIITNLGKNIASEVSKNASKSEKELIDDVKEFFNDLTKDELLLFIYTSYPDMMEDAVEIKNLLPKRKEIAISLYKKAKISIGKASEIAGMNINSMTKELQKRRIYRVDDE